MKLTYQTVALIVLVVAIPTLLVGCGAPNKPSASDVNKLVKENLSKGVPASWVNARF